MKYLAFACLDLLSFRLIAEHYSPAPENLEAREWFQDAKSGHFIHWGVYSVRGERGMGHAQKEIPISE